MPTLEETLDKVRIDDTHKGKGLFANVALNEGTVVTNVHGEHITFEDTTRLGDNESFCVQISLKDYVLPAPPFYYANHSCNPNCGLNEKLELITLRDVSQNEELTWDYSTSMLERHWAMKCECGSSNCRSVVNDFDLLPKEVQQNYLEMGIVLPFIVEYLRNQLRQPLQRQ
jgi:uncharacterized protein